MTVVGLYALINETIRLASRWMNVLLLVTSCTMLLSAVGCTDLFSEKSSSESSIKANESNATNAPSEISSVPLRIRAELPQEVLDAIARRWKSYSEQPIDLQPLDTHDMLSSYATSSGDPSSKSKPQSKPQADILIVESRWLATLAEYRWVRPLPSSLLEVVPNVSHWKRIATYGKQVWGIPLGTNFLVSIERPEKNETLVASKDDLKSFPPEDSVEGSDWIVDRFLLNAAASNPSPNDSSFLFKPTGAKSRLNEAWLAQAAANFVSAQANESSTANLFNSAESAWEETRIGAFQQSFGWPSASKTAIEMKAGPAKDLQNQTEQDCVVVAPKIWTDSGRTLLILIAQTNRQSAASERFMTWLSDDSQRQALAEVTSKIKPLPENQRKVSDRPDRDSYHQLIASAVNQRYVSVELQFAGADAYRQALGKALTKIVRKELGPEEAFQICHNEWESLTNQRGREQQQRLLYRSLELAKWE